jgi:hypothetical protein
LTYAPLAATGVALDSDVERAVTNILAGVGAEILITPSHKLATDAEGRVLTNLDDAEGIAAAISEVLEDAHGPGSWGYMPPEGSVFITESTLDENGTALGVASTDGPTGHVVVYARLASDVHRTGDVYSSESDIDGKYAVEVPSGQRYRITFVYRDWIFESRVVTV